MISRSTPDAHGSSGGAVVPLPLVLSFSTVPVLLGLVVIQSALHHLEWLGESSEEVFRGDRLPVLPFPEQL